MSSKNLIIFTLLALSFSFLSCENELSVIESKNQLSVKKPLNPLSRARLTPIEAQVDFQRLDAFKKLDLNAKHIAYVGILNPSERYFYWVMRLEEESLKESGTKKEIILDLLSNLTIDIFKNEVDAKLFLSEYMTIWNERAIDEFGAAKLGRLTGSILEPDQSSITLDDIESTAIAASAEEDCNCGGTDDRLKRCGPNKRCVDGGCSESWFGCGDILLQSCTGMCS